MGLDWNFLRFIYVNLCVFIYTFNFDSCIIKEKSVWDGVVIMKVQCVGNYDCQRKKDVSFSGLLLDRKAAKLVNALLPNSMHSVTKVTCELQPLQRKLFVKNLFLTEHERSTVVKISCQDGKSPFDYLTQLQNMAQTAGIYDVARIRQAILSKTENTNILALRGNVSGDELVTRLTTYDSWKQKAKAFFSMFLPKGKVKSLQPAEAPST